MLSRKMKLVFGLAMLGLCASISPSLAHGPGKVTVTRHVTYHVAHPVVYPVHSHKVVVVKRPVAVYPHRKVVVVKRSHPVVRVSIR